MILRLPDYLRAELIALGAEPFAPMPGRVMREYVTVPEAIFSSRAKLAAWIAKSQKDAEARPPKEKRKPAAKAAGSRKKIPQPKKNI